MDISWSSVLAIFLTAFMALFPVINPIGDAVIVNGFLRDLDGEPRKRAVRKIVFNCLLIGLGSLIAGHLVLVMFGLAIPAIQVGGGLILCKTGWEWLSEQGGPAQGMTSQEKKEIDMDVFERKLFYPISFPICVDPGAISVIVTLTATAHVKDNLLATGTNYAMIGLAIVVLLAILYVLIFKGKFLTERLGESGNMVINKLVAFITFCIGIQIVVEGISKIFGLHISL